MHSTHQKPQIRNFRTILPVILRITFSLILWALGAATMEIAAAQTREHREIRNFPMDRAHIATLQRWVNSGHDEWCRDPQLAASAAVRQVSRQFSESEFELAYLPLGGEASRVTKAIYTYHSLDGRTTYRITLRRFRWLLPTAGTFRQMIWVPERAEIITRDTFD